MRSGFTQDDSAPGVTRGVVRLLLLLGLAVGTYLLLALLDPAAHADDATDPIVSITAVSGGVEKAVPEPGSSVAKSGSTRAKSSTPTSAEPKSTAPRSSVQRSSVQRSSVQRSSAPKSAVQRTAGSGSTAAKERSPKVQRPVLKAQVARLSAGQVPAKVRQVQVPKVQAPKVQAPKSTRVRTDLPDLKSQLPAPVTSRASTLRAHLPTPPLAKLSTLPPVAQVESSARRLLEIPVLPRTAPATLIQRLPSLPAAELPQLPGLPRTQWPQWAHLSPGQLPSLPQAQWPWRADSAPGQLPAWELTPGRAPAAIEAAALVSPAALLVTAGPAEAYAYPHLPFGSPRSAAAVKVGAGSTPGPGSPRRPADGSTSTGQARDSGGGSAPTMATVSSVWRPEVAAAGSRLATDRLAGGRTVRYAGPPS
ncbi:hypothetical protein GCM10010172_16130 [Paractinoplanes ferrugineus]|uniref:Uncharacterized protein n=1 Tax=Paractinoplanes ferrugineus TaxID=113564 RepID=A0A919IYL0_9ACTN|nr:hypothetical protein [Actinoplanes ferrugineus]GIE10177.1 hypothetical protein Afe05nite_20170 [Actinoplanes ferrugineus]